MAEEKAKCESNTKENKPAIGPIHQQMSDAGQFSCGAICALFLRKLFEDDINRQFNKDTLTMILNGLEQPKQVQESIQAMYDGAGQDDIDPFVDVILKEGALEGDPASIVSELIGFAVAEGKYDARTRTLIKHIAWRLHVSLDCMEEVECMLTETILAQKYEMSEEEKAEKEKKARRRKYKRFALIGLATVTGGTLIGLTGGLAAPLVAAGAGAIIGGAGAAALGSVAGVAIIGSLFGVAGAGLTGYKMKKRVGAIEEFGFEPLVFGGPLRMQSVRQQLHITITVTGWLDKTMPDFKQPWYNLAESEEQYTLRWESRYLKDLGQAMDYIFNSAVSLATSEALKYTVLSSIMAAIAWPSALLSVSRVIDNPWSVALQRAVATGRQLAEVLLSREQGRRPVTLIGYSLGGRVIFYCLEEMAKRKGCEGIVEDVIILGAPVTGDPKSWSTFHRVVAGKIVNGYCRGDWLLNFLYRTASVQFSIAGLRPVKWDNHRMHNIDLSNVVTGHMDYMKQLDSLLSVAGIRVREEVKVDQTPGKKGYSIGMVSPSSSFASVSSKETGSVKSSSGSSLSDISRHGDQNLAESITSGTTAGQTGEEGTTEKSGLQPELNKQRMEQMVKGEEEAEETPEATALGISSQADESPLAASRSVSNRLKNLFSRKKDVPQPENQQKPALQESVNQTSTTESCKKKSVENQDSQPDSDSNSSVSTVDRENNIIAALDAEVNEVLEKERLERGKENDSKHQADKGDGKEQIDPVMTEQLTQTEKAGLPSEDSEDDTYTSSNPCSSPEEEISAAKS